MSTSPIALIEGLIPRHGIVVVWGPPKCGKTFWVYDLLMHAAIGRNYRGRHVEQGKVVYIACEGARGLQARTEAFRRAKLKEDERDPDFYLIASRLDLVADVDQLIADIDDQIGEDGIAAIGLDTLNRSLVGSESKDEDMAAYLEAADRLRERYHCVVIIIHHCGIDATRPRGHTSLTGTADAQIAVKRDSVSNIIATLEYMKDGLEGDEIVSRLQVVDIGIDQHGQPITSCVVEPVESENEGPAEADKPKAVKLPASAKVALDMLRKAIADAGEIPPASNHIPSNTRCVSEDLWQQYCYRGAISAGKQNAKRMAFNRAAETLIAADRVRKWEPWMWLV
jgi:KaiC/GvpD/RAD55 family RecA-like ATPase